MQTRRSWWSSIWGTVWGLLTLLGVSLSFLVLSFATVVVVFCLAAGAAAVATMVYDLVRTDSPTTGSGSGGGRTAWTCGAVAGGVVLAVTAVGALSGALLLLMLLAAGGSSPWALRFMLGTGPGRWRTATPESMLLDDVDGWPGPLGPLGDRVSDVCPPGVGAGSAVSSSMQSLSDAELCRAWQISFNALSDTNGVEVQTRVVELRQAYLDEIDRRHPAGLAAWLNSGARAAGNPACYLASREPPTRSG